MLHSNVGPGRALIALGLAVVLVVRAPGGGSIYTLLLSYVAFRATMTWTIGTVRYFPRPAGPEDLRVFGTLIYPDGSSWSLPVLVRRSNGHAVTYETLLIPPPGTRLDIGDYDPQA